MALIAFCAIALVENVTNAHPAGGEERGGAGGVGLGVRRRRREERTKNRDKRVTHTSSFFKKRRPKQEVENNIFISQSMSDN